MEEVILLKIESIEKCLSRIEEKKAKPGFDLNDLDMQDIIVLNLQRACQQAIDLAMFIVAQLGLGMPKSSADAFDKLYDAEIIDSATLKTMRGMVGFRNVAVHEYQRVDNAVVQAVINNHLNDFREFNRLLIENCIEQ